MDRRRFLLTSLAGALGTPLAAAAQARIPLVAYLADGIAGPGPARTEIEVGLREQGYVVGADVVIEGRGAEGRMERLAGLAAELVRLQPDVILVVSDRGAVAARQATSTIPIVMILGVDPVRLGLIKSLAQPGGNVTGLTVDAGPEIIAKRLQILRELAPDARSIAVLTERPPEGTRRLDPVESAARASGVSVSTIHVGRPEALDDAFAEITRHQVKALLVSGASMLYLSRSTVSALALRHKLPAIYPLRAYAEAGGLVSYGVEMFDLFRRGGGLAGKIIKGAKPAHLPVEQPTKFELVINLKTAKALGLTIPPSLLARADQVIE